MHDSIERHSLSTGPVLNKCKLLLTFLLIFGMNITYFPVLPLWSSQAFFVLNLSGLKVKNIHSLSEDRLPWCLLKVIGHSQQPWKPYSRFWVILLGQHSLANWQLPGRLRSCSALACTGELLCTANNLLWQKGLKSSPGPHFTTFHYMMHL